MTDELNGAGRRGHHVRKMMATRKCGECVFATPWNDALLCRPWPPSPLEVEVREKGKATRKTINVRVSVLPTDPCCGLFLGDDDPAPPR